VQRNEGKSTGMVKYASSLCPTASTKAPDITRNVAINRWHYWSRSSQAWRKF